MARKRPADPTLDDPLARALCRLFDRLDGVQAWVKDTSGRYCWVNRGFLINYACERDADVLGRTDHDLSPAPLADQYVADDAEVLGGRPLENRVELVGRFDRTAGWSRTTKLPIKDRRGGIVGTVGMTRRIDPEAVEDHEADADLGRVLTHIRRHVAEPLSNPRLARVAGRSVRSLERLFRRQVQASPQQYLRRLRIRLACRAILDSRGTLTEIAAGLGFYDQSHFVREFRREVGLTPGAYRARYAGFSGPGRQPVGEPPAVRPG
jgi:AraC-like DNA-binding protein